MKKIVQYFFLLLFVPFLISCNGSSTNHSDDQTIDNQIVVGQNGEDQMLQKLSKALEDDPDNINHLVARSNYYIGLGDLNKALRDINAALAIDTTTASIFTTLADVYLQMGEIQRSESSLLKALTLEPNYVPAYLKLSRFYLIFKNYKESMKYAELALRHDEVNAEGFYLIGFNFMESGDTAKAVRSFLMAVELNQQYYDAWLRLGVIHSARLRPLAEHYYKNAINVRPESVEARYLLAMYYQATEDWEKSVQAYERIIGLDTSFLDAYYNKGYIQLVYLQDFANARDAFTKVLQMNSRNANAFLNRGVCHEELGDFLDAKYDFSKAVELSNNDPLAIEAMGRIEKKIRQLKK